MADDQYQADSIGKKVNNAAAMAAWTLSQAKLHKGGTKGSSLDHHNVSNDGTADDSDDRCVCMCVCVCICLLAPIYVSFSC